MKPGDIVAVDDGSWSMSVINGSLEYVDGNSLGRRRFRVLRTGGKYPAADYDLRGLSNDIMLVDENDPDYMLFIRHAFCRIVTPPPSIPHDTVDLTIPPGVTTVTLHLEHK